MTENQVPEAKVGTPRPRRTPVTILAVLLLFALGIFIGRYIVPAGNAATGSLRFVTVENGERQLIFPTFWEAKDILETKFIGELDEEKLFYGAIEGMIAAAGDPYTVFANPENTSQFEQTIEGSFTGVGIEIGMRQGLVTVIAPLLDSPAEKAGVREGDIIVAIDGESITQEMTLDDVVSRIRGPRGSEVTLTVVHKDERTTEDITIARDTIQIESVKLTIENGIAHIIITSFNGDTASRFTTVAREVAQRDDVQGIILDVRNNPGGFLRGAVDIASLFLPEGKVVVSERGKESTEYTAKGNTILADIPIIVLVNEGSASASEILAGALHDQLNAPLIGTQTFGKGSVQEFIKLDDGSSLRVTVAKWFTPNGRNINDDGIEPTITVEQDHETDQDEVLDRAREEIARLIGN